MFLHKNTLCLQDKFSDTWILKILSQSTSTYSCGWGGGGGKTTIKYTNKHKETQNES